LLDTLFSTRSWGVKANSQGKHNYWFGYKGHFAVSATSQYLLIGLTTSAFVSDSSVAIPIMRKLSEFLGLKRTRMFFDKGYDTKAIYSEVHTLFFEPIKMMEKQRIISHLLVSLRNLVVMIALISAMAH
jgi:hypothetical protein